MKLEKHLAQTKADFAAIAAAFNIDLQYLANEAVKSGVYPMQTLWSLFSELRHNKESEDGDDIWAWRAKNGGVPRSIPFVSREWMADEIYATANDDHIRTLLKRVLVSFANPDYA